MRRTDLRSEHMARYHSATGNVHLRMRASSRDHDLNHHRSLGQRSKGTMTNPTHEEVTDIEKLARFIDGRAASMREQEDWFRNGDDDEIAGADPEFRETHARNYAELATQYEATAAALRSLRVEREIVATLQFAIESQNREIDSLRSAIDAARLTQGEVKKGMLPMGERSHCPHCGADLCGAAISEEDQRYYGGATHGKREILIEIPEAYDGGLFYRCPDCNGEWHRFPEGHRLRTIAEKYILAPTPGSAVS